MPFFIPLLLLGAPIVADFIFQYLNEQEREKKQKQLLQEGYSPRAVAETDIRSDEGGFFVSEFEEQYIQEEPFDAFATGQYIPRSELGYNQSIQGGQVVSGADYLRAALFG